MCKTKFKHLNYFQSSKSESRSVVLWPHELYSPRNSPGQNTGVGSLSLLQRNLPNPGTEPRSPALPAEPQGKPKIQKRKDWITLQAGERLALPYSSVPVNMCGRDRNRKSPFAISGVIIVAHRDHWGTLTFLDKRIRTNRILSSFESSSHKIQINRKKIMTVEKANRYPLNQVVQINHTDIRLIHAKASRLWFTKKDTAALLWYSGQNA